jgi:hypothetical protein
MKMILSRAALAISLLAMTAQGHAQAQQETTISDEDIKVLDFESLKYPVLAHQTNYQGVVVVRNETRHGRKSCRGDGDLRSQAFDSRLLGQRQEMAFSAQCKPRRRNCVQLQDTVRFICEM